MLENKKILIVEDKDIVSQPTAKYFDKNNWCVEVAEDGSIALEILINTEIEKINCMLLDLKMTELDGDELLRELKRKNIKPPKTIILSAYINDIDKKELRRLGVVEFINKPCPPRNIESIASKIINNK